MNIISQILKNFLLLFVRSVLLGTLLRSSIIFILAFYVAPLFFPTLAGGVIQIQLAILVMILVEMLVWRFDLSEQKKVQQEEDGEEDKEVIFEEFIAKKLDFLIRKKNFYLFLHTKSIDIISLLSEQNYSALDIEALRSKEIQLFDDFHSMIMSCELEVFYQLIERSSGNFQKKIRSYLRNNKNPICNIVLSLQDLSSAGSTQHTLQRQLYLAMRFLHSSMRSNYNINILIDNLEQIKGFNELIDSDQDGDANMFSNVFVCNIADPEQVHRIFREESRIFFSNLENHLLTHHTQEADAYQKSYFFIEQIRCLYDILENLISLFTIPTQSFFSRKKKMVMLGIHFMSSGREVEVVPPLSKAKFEGYISLHRGGDAV